MELPPSKLIEKLGHLLAQAGTTSPFISGTSRFISAPLGLAAQPRPTLRDTDRSSVTTTSRERHHAARRGLLATSRHLAASPKVRFVTRRDTAPDDLGWLRRRRSRLFW